MTTFFDIAASRGKRLSGRDFVLGSAIATGMLCVWLVGSSGLSLIATFVPGLVFAWAVFARMHFRRVELPDVSALLPPYYLALGWQFIHFTEEYATNFREAFPGMYGGAPYPATTFVAFNMAAYLVFTVAPVLVYFRGLTFFLMPMLFFVVYGALGNAVSHVWWSILRGKYFPGLYSAVLYWVLAPPQLAALLESRRAAAIFVAVFSVVLAILLTALRR